MLLYSQDTLESMNFHRVKIVGEFDHSKELFLGPRTVNKPQLGLSANEGGYHVVTPFKLLDSGYDFNTLIFGFTHCCCFIWNFLSL